MELLNEKDMGKGDKKTKRGKISRGSYGVKRRKKIKKQAPVEERISVDTKK